MNDPKTPSRLELLQQSILAMTMEEKFQVLREVRESRRMSKAPILKERKARVAKSDADKMLDRLTPAQKAELMAMLGIAVEKETDSGTGT